MKARATRAFRQPALSLTSIVGTPPGASQFLHVVLVERGIGLRSPFPRGGIVCLWQAQFAIRAPAMLPLIS